MSQIEQDISGATNTHSEIDRWKINYLRNQARKEKYAVLPFLLVSVQENALN